MSNFVVSVIGDKGGIGKTTLAYNLICRLLRDEPSCQLIDCDNDQYSSADFAADRNEANVLPRLPVFSVPTKNLLDHLRKNKEKVSIIEFGKSYGEDEEQRKKALELAIKISDVVLTIMAASPVDAKALGKFESKLPPQIANVPAFLIPNRVKSKAQLKSLWEGAPALQYFKVTESFLPDKLCFQLSLGDDGRSIFEYRPKNKSGKARPLNKQEKEAQQQFEQLYQEFLRICQH